MTDKALLREILDDQLELVCRFRADGTILFVNRAYARTLDREPAELTGQNLWAHVTAEDHAHVSAMLEQLSPTSPELTIENRFETSLGTRWTLWRNHALAFDDAGRWQVAQSTGIDITARKQLEEQLELLVDELNHRVKNTLMVVQAMAHQTFRGTDLPMQPVAKFNNRLAALSGAHDALSRANWGGAPTVRNRTTGTADLWSRRRARRDRRACRRHAAIERHGVAGHGAARTGHQRDEIWRTVDRIGQGVDYVDLQPRG